MIAQKPDVLLMGGDYQEGCEYVEPLFAALARVKTPMGTFGVMGNNDYERCHDEIIRTMKHYGMRPLEHEVDTLRKDGQQIILAGVRNPFDLKQNGVSPTLALSPNDFVILLVHTPDYVEDVSVANTDIALAGHTHGGQVRVFGYAPIQNSHYGTRFLTGLAYNSTKMPLIVTNGIGTSQMPADAHWCSGGNHNDYASSSQRVDDQCSLILCRIYSLIYSQTFGCKKYLTSFFSSSA